MIWAERIGDRYCSSEVIAAVLVDFCGMRVASVMYRGTLRSARGQGVQRALENMLTRVAIAENVTEVVAATDAVCVNAGQVHMNLGYS